MLELCRCIACTAFDLPPLPIAWPALHVSCPRFHPIADAPAYCTATQLELCTWLWSALCKQYCNL